MPDYLSKEEVKQWRSSLEKLTLEEYALKLGKQINNAKETNDIVDMVMNKTKIGSVMSSEYTPKAETLKSIAQKALSREKELMKSPAQPKSQPVIDNKKFIDKINDEKNVLADINLSFTFKKPLTTREQAVLDYFAANRNTIIYAKDLARLLDLPRDYVYKYIKNLRNKLSEDAIVNSENGGFLLKV